MSTEANPPEPTADSTANFLYASSDLDPVNTFTGELYTQKPRDIDLGGPMALYFQRYYGSYLRRSFILGDLGSNWRHNFDARLFISGNTASYISPEGRLTNFLKDLDSGSWNQSNNRETPYQLVTGPAQDAKLYDPQVERAYTFDFTTNNILSGRLINVEDGHGNAHSVSYDLDNGQIKTVSDGLGRTLSFFYNTDSIPKISVVSDGTRSASFQYTDPEDSEYLIQVNDVLGGVTTYTYKGSSGNADHALMTSYQRPEGNIPYTQTFYDVPDAASGRVATQTDADGNTHSFQYSGLETTLTDPLGNTRIHSHTAAGEFANRQD